MYLQWKPTSCLCPGSADERQMCSSSGHQISRGKMNLSQIPPLSKWQKMSGGTYAAPNKKGYVWFTLTGQYTISPKSSGSEHPYKHLGYLLRYYDQDSLSGHGIDTRGSEKPLPSSECLYLDPAKAVRAARLHFNRNL